MQSISHTSVVICFMVMIYLFFVGSVSWVAWKRRDDGMRWLALGLCSFTLAYVLAALRDILPTTLMMGAYYCLLGQAYVFLQGGVLKVFRRGFDWKWLEIPFLLLVLSNCCLWRDRITLETANFLIYVLQYFFIAATILWLKRKIPSCGSNMVFVGMVLAAVIDLWWIWQMQTVPDTLQITHHPRSFQARMDFLTYVISLLVTNGFILMAKELVETKLEENRRTDELTGLQSHRWLEPTAQRYLTRLKQRFQPVTLILVDIDHFRDINRLYGHACGDQIIQELSQFLLRHYASTSDIFRMQNGSFAILDCDRNIYQVTEKCEAARRFIACHHFAGDKEISVSCGVAVGRASDHWEDWLGRATKALSVAKAHGRNKIHVCEMEFSAEHLPAGVVRVGKLQWMPAYSTGDRQLDEQHQQLLLRANVMLQLWVRTSDKMTICKAASDFLQLVAEHFQFEISLLKSRSDSTNAKSVEKHATIHAQILARANNLLARYQQNTITNDTLFSFLVFEFAVPHSRSEAIGISALMKN